MAGRSIVAAPNYETNPMCARSTHTVQGGARLAWSEPQELARRACVRVATVHQLEAGISHPHPATEVIRRAFETAGVEFTNEDQSVRATAGVEFIDENGGGPATSNRGKRANPAGELNCLRATPGTGL